MRKFYPGSVNDDLNEEQMATALQVSVAVLPLTKIVNLLENPPDDGISTLPPAKPKGGEVYLYKPRCDTEKGINIATTSAIQCIHTTVSLAHSEDSHLPAIEKKCVNQSIILIYVQMTGGVISTGGLTKVFVYFPRRSLC